MKKLRLLFIAVIIFVATVAIMLTAGASSEVTAETYEHVYIGEYTSTEISGTGCNYSGEAHIVFGKVTGTTDAGILLERYAKDDYLCENLIETKYFNAREGRITSQGEFAIALYNVADGYYKAQVVANFNTNPIKGEYTTFSKGSTVKSLTQSEWENAFVFDNVTINSTIVSEEFEDKYAYLFNGDTGLMVYGDMQLPMDGEYMDVIKSTLDFSALYGDAVMNQPDIYFVKEYDVYGDESLVYKNAYLTFSDGHLVNLTATMEELTDEYDDEYNVIGTTTITSNVTFDFSDYGTTDATFVSQLPVTEDEWLEIFNKEKLDNVTIKVTLYDGLVEYIYDADGKEKATVEGYDNVELYCIDDVWYRYTINSDTYTIIEQSDEDYSYTTIGAGMKGLFEYIRNDLYAFATYDEVEDVYYISADESDMMMVTITDGYVTKFVQVLEGDVWTFELYDYGTTSFTVPF